MLLNKMNVSKVFKYPMSYVIMQNLYENLFEHLTKFENILPKSFKRDFK